MCSNHLTATNDKVYKMFKRLAKEKNKKKYKYFNIGHDLFDIYCEGGNFVSFETRWTPPLDLPLALSKKFNCEVEMEFSEPTNFIHGIVTTFEGNSVTLQLDEKDFDRYYYDESKDLYFFNDNYYESDVAVLELILQEKL